MINEMLLQEFRASPIRLHDMRVENTFHPTCSECVCMYLSAAEAQHASASFNVYAHL